MLFSVIYFVIYYFIYYFIFIIYYYLFIILLLFIILFLLFCYLFILLTVIYFLLLFSVGRGIFAQLLKKTVVISCWNEREYMLSLLEIKAANAISLSLHELIYLM